jgi:hypothetical protein
LNLYFQGGGYLQLRFNLGSQDHHLRYDTVFVNDGQTHLLRMHRHRSNVTLLLDQNLPMHYVSKNSNELFTLNSQHYAVVGASFNVLHSATVYSTSKEKRAAIQVFDEFSGRISGVNFNGLMILDLFAGGEYKRTVDHALS